MPASSSKALAAAIAAAQRQRDLARRDLARQHQGLHAAQAQMAQLQSYTHEMQQRWGAQPGQRLPCELLRHHQQFMERMAHASALQTSALQAQHGQVQAAQNTLAASELRLSSLRQLAGQRQRAQAAQRSRHAQQQADERSALQFLRLHRTLAEESPQP